MNPYKWGDLTQLPIYFRPIYRGEITPSNGWPRVKRNCNSSTASPLHPKDPKTPQGTRRSAGRFKTTPKASFTSFWDACGKGEVRSFEKSKNNVHSSRAREVPISHTYPNCLWSKVENKSKTERWVHPTPFLVQTFSPQTCDFFLNVSWNSSSKRTLLNVVAKSGKFCRIHRSANQHPKKTGEVRLMAEILHHLGCTKP